MPFLYLTIRTPDRHHIDRRQFAGSGPSPTLSIADVRVALLAGHPRCGGRGLKNFDDNQGPGFGDRLFCEAVTQWRRMRAFGALRTQSGSLREATLLRSEADHIRRSGLAAQEGGDVLLPRAAFQSVWL